MSIPAAKSRNPTVTWFFSYPPSLTPPPPYKKKNKTTPFDARPSEEGKKKASSSLSTVLFWCLLPSLLPGQRGVGRVARGSRGVVRRTLRTRRIRSRRRRGKIPGTVSGDVTRRKAGSRGGDAHGMAGLGVPRFRIMGVFFRISGAWSCEMGVGEQMLSHVALVAALFSLRLCFWDNDSVRYAASCLDPEIKRCRYTCT